jgi:hypothetical protein
MIIDDEFEYLDKHSPEVRSSTVFCAAIKARSQKDGTPTKGATVRRSSSV